MTYPGAAEIHPVIRKLSRVIGLTEDEKASVAGIPMTLADFGADQDMVREGDHPTRCFALLDGFARTSKITSEGRRQIVAFHVPGDMPDLQSLNLSVLDVSIGTLTPCRVGFIHHDVVRELCQRFPRLAAAFWHETLIDAAVFREWVTNIGQRPASARIAHLICEFVYRLQAVGLADGNACSFPMTQSVIGEATGMSAVHVNRSLQELRAKGLFILHGQRLKILDWHRLKDFGEFDPVYLHLRSDAVPNSLNEPGKDANKP